MGGFTSGRMHRKMGGWERKREREVNSCGYMDIELEDILRKLPETRAREKPLARATSLLQSDYRQRGS